MFYLTEITKQKSTQKESKSVYVYETINDAEGNFHQKLGNWMKSDDCEYEIISVIDKNGQPVLGLSKAFYNQVEE